MRQAQVAPRRSTEQPRPVAPPPKPTLFVENFAMSGIDLDQVHLVAGFRMELIACLTRFREWYVSGSSDHGAELGNSTISRRYTLSTTAYKAGATINVVMVLQEPPSEVAIWGERFELRLDNWFESQQRIIRRIAATLNVQLSVERLIRLSQVPDGSLEAHDIWLRGQMVINGYMAGEWNRVARTLVEAIDREPNFSPLYSSLAQMNNVIHFVQPGLFRDERHVQQTLTLAQRAVTLDPRDSRAQLCLGWALAFCRRYGQAELHMEIACELNGNDPHTLMSAAAFYGYKGETKHALKQATTSMELSVVPTLTQWQYLANIRYLDGDYEGAILAAERAQDGLLTMPALRAAALARLGRQQEAAQDVVRFYANVRAAWSGSQPPTDELIGKWLLHIYPFSREEAWQRMRDGMALAGIPVTGLAWHG
jgi:TolB-like protein